jgi:chromosome segregation ATPase
MSAQPSPRQDPFDDGSNQRRLSDPFIAPRIIDRTAFDQFTHKLDALIQGAEASGRSLQDASESAREAETALRRGQAELEAKAGDIARMVPTLQDRMQQLESLLTEAVEEVPQRLRSRIDSQIDSLIAARLETFDDELKAMFDGATARGRTSLRLEPGESPAHGAPTADPQPVETTDVESRLRLGDVASLSEQAHEARDLLAMGLLKACERMDSIESRAASLFAQLQAWISAGEQSARVFEARRERAEGAFDELTEAMQGDCEAARARLSLMLAAIDQREQACRSLCEDLTSLMDSLRKWRESIETQTQTQTQAQSEAPQTELTAAGPIDGRAVPLTPRPDVFGAGETVQTLKEIARSLQQVLACLDAQRPSTSAPDARPRKTTRRPRNAG